MEIFYAADAPYIRLLSAEHFFYLALILSVIGIVWIKRRALAKDHPKTTRWLLGLSLFQQVLLYLWYAFNTGFDLTQALPLHLCRISSLLGIVYLSTKQEATMDVVFYFGLFAYASVLYPKAINAPYHLLGISYLINHAITLVLPLIAWHAFGWRPRRSRLFWTMGWFLLYFALAYGFNRFIGGNYF